MTFYGLGPQGSSPGRANQLPHSAAASLPVSPGPGMLESKFLPFFFVVVVVV